MRHITGVILAIALLVMLLIAWAFPRMNEDLFLGLCLGREVANGTFTDPNSWSFVIPAQVFVDRAWLPHLIYYVSYALLGFLGPVSIKGILLACYATILYFRCRALDLSGEISLLAVTLGMFPMAPFLSIRGENFGILCFLALTTFLAASSSWGRYRQVGAALVLVLWSNCHGTWPIGILLIGMRFGIDLLYRLNVLKPPFVSEAMVGAGFKPAPTITAPSATEESEDGHGRLGPKNQQNSGPDPVGWLVTGLAVVPLLLLVNPFGWRNFLVFDYVRGMNQFERVTAWRDNAPLLYLPDIVQKSFYDPMSVLPFFTILFFLVLLASTALLLRRKAVVAARSFDASNIGDKWMEIAAVILLIPLAFKWRRLIPFCAPALVPVLGLLIQANVGLLNEQLSPSRGFGVRLLRKWSAPVAALAGLAVLSILFATYVVIAYLPNNPMGYLRVAPPLQERMMTYDLAWKDVVGFMKRNHISGRIMASLQLADYLLLEVPDVRVFMDLRAQAAYTPANFADYFEVVRAGPRSGSASRAADVLDRFQVDFVVLESIVEYHTQAAVALMETRKWACIYKDRWVYVLARPDSELFRSTLSAGSLDALWYKNAETRYVSEAFLSQFTTGSMPVELLGRVKEAVREFPDPETYVLIARAMRGNQRCFPEGARNYLSEAALRLTRTNYMVSGGVRDIVGSARMLFDLLAYDATECGPKALGQIYQEDADRMGILYRQLCRKYSILVKCR